MTTTEIATLDDLEVPESQQLSKRDAKALDKKVRTTSDKVSKGFATLDETIETLGNLIQEAIDGEIHKGLGLKSWTVWVKDAVQVTVPDRFQRKELVRELSKNGMSQRAIASVFNVSQKTVDRDLDDEEVEDGATVTSLDGAERPKGRKSTAAEEESEEDYIEGEVVEEEPEPMKAVDIVSAFDEEMGSLWNAHSEIVELTHEDKWAGARNRIVKANLNHLQEVITNLQSVVDVLMTD